MLTGRNHQRVGTGTIAERTVDGGRLHRRGSDFGPLVPWLPGAPGLAEWDSAKDKRELYRITQDFSQADDLAAKEPKRLSQL